MAVAPLNIDIGASGLSSQADEISRMDSYHHDEGQVLQRFLVTKSRAMFATGSTIKYIEVMADGSVRIRDAKDSKSADYHYDPISVFERGDENSVNISMNAKKKREFKFSSLDEKKAFFQLIQKTSSHTPHHIPSQLDAHNYHHHSNGSKPNSQKFSQRIKQGLGAMGASLNSPVQHAHHKMNKMKGKQRYTTEKFIKINNELDPVIMKDCVIKRSGSENEYYGKLIGLTNYRMIVKETFHEEHVSAAQMMNQTRRNQPLKFNESDPIIPALEIHHNSVRDFDVAGDSNKVTINTKDFRTIIVEFGQVSDFSLKQQYIEMLRRHMTPVDDRDIFAFKAYQNSLKKLEKSGLKITKQSNAAERERVNNAVFRELKSTRFDENHKLFLMKREYTRISKPFGIIDETSENFAGVNGGGNSGGQSPSIHQSPYRLSYANVRYELCSTYPKILMVPNNADDALLRKASNHRSRNRLPVITWANEYKVTIARCSQPTAGITNKKSFEDMELLRKLNELNTHSDSYVICDCRPRINAVVNALKGKGYEETSKSYAGSHIIFFDIQNIHQMRSSINSIKKCCESQESDDWLSILSGTKWFQHLSKILQCAKRVASMVDKDRYSVLVHCSDGWDRTAQICALSELLLDPYYRKFEGFQILIQKEWLWFGHKFADRNGNYTTKRAKNSKNSDADNDDTENAKMSSKKDERSPIFVQFLDTVYQVMKQFPWAFEFTHELLLEYATHVSSGRFGDFFCNCDQERDESQLWVRTGSLFKYLDKLWKSGIFRNPDYTPTSTVLRPRFAVKDIVLWDELYCRFSSHDKDTRLKLNAAVTSSFTLGHSQSSTATANGPTGPPPVPANVSSSSNNKLMFGRKAASDGSSPATAAAVAAAAASFEMKMDDMSGGSGADAWDDDENDYDIAWYRKRNKQLEAMIREYQKNGGSGSGSVASSNGGTPRARPPPKKGSINRRLPPNKKKSQAYTSMGGNIV